MQAFRDLVGAVATLPTDRRFGRVRGIRGALIEVSGLAGAAQVGSRLAITRGRETVEAEVAAIEGDAALALAFGEPDGISAGVLAELRGTQGVVRPTSAWLGRVVDGLGRPIDGKGPLPAGGTSTPTRNSPLPAGERGRVGERISTGVAALDLFAPLCRGQRLGLFAGSGVGKSVLLSMLARGTGCDVAVIGLIGERGREVQEFIEDDLGPEGLARSVVVVATSDEPAVLRRQAAWTTMALAEYFRDRGAHVLCLMDSVTRFAMAQREIGLAAGEPPASKGYTPSVFAELPRLLERAGPGRSGSGAISGLFTVLVDGDDHNEPVADAVRGILDGHVVMSRRIAERGRYPAVDLLKSVSRTLPHCLPPEQNGIRLAARRCLSTYSDMEDLVRLGAYKAGANAEVDRHIALAPQIEALLCQAPDQRHDTDEMFQALSTIVETAA